MFIRQSYDQDFQHLLLDLKDKYPARIFQLEGIDTDSLDIVKYSKNYFGNKKENKSIADNTIDPNANVQIRNIATYQTESVKGIEKLNSLYLLWVNAKKLYGTREANTLIEKEINKEINIQDAVHAYKPYSYYSQTPILLKINGEEVYWTMKQLYEAFETFSKFDTENNMFKIKVEDIKQVFDYKTSFIVSGKRKRKQENNIYAEYIGDITQKVSIDIWDSEKGWVKLKQIIKHERESDKKFIIYQTNSGDFAFVTEDHPVILSDNSEKNANSLIIGDEILKNDILPDYEERVTVPENIAYITGFILGDGNCNGYLKNYDYIKRNVLGKDSASLKLCRGNNTILIYQKDVHNSDIKKKVEETFGSLDFYTLGGDANKLGFTSQPYSLLYGNYFNCGYKENSFSKRLPENIMFWDNASIYALVSGLIDSDGSINAGLVQLRLSSYAIINQLYDVLRSRGFKVKKNVFEFNNRLGNNFIFGISFRVNECFSLSEKIKKVEKSQFSYNENMDTTIKDNKIKKIIILDESKLSPSTYLKQEIKNVYDVTTETGRFYANGMIQHNCWAFDTYDVLEKGLLFVTNYPSVPAKHSDVFLQHVIQLLQYAAPQLVGATAIPNVLVIYSALLKYDSEDENYPIPDYRVDEKMFNRYFEQRMQELVFLLNQPLRQVQSTFTNITIFDRPFLTSLCNMYLIKGNNIDIDFAMKVQKDFLVIFNKMQEKQLATFPVLTVQFKKNEKGEVEDEDLLDFISEINIPWGHINIFNDISLNALSSCCRLVNNVEDIIKAAKDENMNLIGGSSIKVGSLGVTTINLVRVALMSNKDEDKFFEILNKNAEDCYKINHCRRTIIQRKISEGEMPLYDLGFMSLKNQYSTLGLNGLNECLDFMGYDIKTEEGKQFAIKVQTFLDDLCNRMIKKYEYRCNIEQIPAEGTASKLAEADKILYKQDKYVIYANQFIPLTEETELLKRIELQSEFEKYFSGGTILHINVGEKIKSKEVMKSLIRYVIKQGVKYFAVNYFFKKCKEGHMTYDNGQSVCELCNSEIVEKYTRVVGFMVPISSWSKQRKEEYKERKRYTNGSLNL